MFTEKFFTLSNPWCLLLLCLLPLVWWAGRKSLVALPRPRAWLTVVTRTIVFLLLVLVLAEAKFHRVNPAVSVVYVLDQSLSIPKAQRAAMFRYVARSVDAHRNQGRGDLAGVIVFGRVPAVEAAPTEGELAWLQRSEATLPSMREATNLAVALKLSLATLPAESSRRIVLVTDGNENIDQAHEIAPQLAAHGVGIDVVPIRLKQQPDAAVEKIELPSDVQQRETVEARVVIAHRIEDSNRPMRPLTGKLRIARRTGGHSESLVEQQVELKPGKNVFPFVHTLDKPPGFYTYEAEFFPDDSARERTQRNNRATAFVRVRGKGRVLLIENSETPGEFDHLVKCLQENGMLVDLRRGSEAFSNLADLQAYDTVVMANVARYSRGDGAGVLFSDEQINALARNTEMGCGLVILGGPNSFGAGGWANTALEDASPVNFQLKNSKVSPSGALVLVIDKSSSMGGNKINMSRQAAIEAVRVLGARDHVGVIAFDSFTRWIVPMQSIGQEHDEIERRIGRLSAHGGTNLYPAMEKGLDALRPVNAATKHVIVLSDGQTQPNEFEQLVREGRKENVSISTVAIGENADRRLLSRIATLGGGNFYHANSPREIPRIFIKEATRVARPLVFERSEGFSPQIIHSHEILRGIDGTLPPIRGFVLTEVKPSPLVEVSLRSPIPEDDKTATVLASWNYGLGRSVVFTSDAGHRWATDWTAWPQFELLFAQMIRWSMRPTEGDHEFLVSTEVEDGKIRAIVSAFDEQDKFLNFLDIGCLVTTPNMATRRMNMQQSAPGRYVGEIEIEEPGSYFLSINSGRAGKSIVTGVAVPYSGEFDDHETNWPLLQALAWQEPQGGEPGVMIHGDLLRPEAGDLLQFDVFRPTLLKSTSVQDIWPIITILAASAFFVDVLVRRVAILPRPLLLSLLAMFRWPTPHTHLPDDTRLKRLHHRKAEITKQLQGRLRDGNSRILEEEPLTDPTDGTSLQNPRTTTSSSPDAREESPYLSRLLKAKQDLNRYNKPKRD